MPDKSWKAFERRVAKKIGGRRTGVLGGEDVEHPRWSIECKLLQFLPKWLTEIMKQAEDNCPTGKIPLAVVKQKYDNDEDAYVILRSKNFNWEGK